MISNDQFSLLVEDIERFREATDDRWKSALALGLAPKLIAALRAERERGRKLAMALERINDPRHCAHCALIAHGALREYRGGQQ